MANYPTETGYQPLYAGASRGATAPTAAEVYAQGRTGLRLDVNVSAITGTSVTFTLQAYDPMTQTWFTLLASAAVVAASRIALFVDPRIATAANASAQQVLPNRMRLSVTHTTITAVTYSAVATLSY